MNSDDVLALRLQHRLQDDVLVGKVVHCVAHEGWALIKPLDPTQAGVFKKGAAYAHFADIKPGVGDGRVYLEQIVAFKVDFSNARGPRARIEAVLEDPFESQRFKRAA